MCAGKEGTRLECMQAVTNPAHLGPNTPCQHGYHSEAWKCVKHLKGDHFELKFGFTHQCVLSTGKDSEGNGLVCNHLLKVGCSFENHNVINAETELPTSVRMRKWLTTKVLDHLEAEHPRHKLAYDRAKRKLDKNQKNITALAHVGDRTTKRSHDRGAAHQL